MSITIRPATLAHITEIQNILLKAQTSSPVSSLTTCL